MRCFAMLKTDREAVVTRQRGLIGLAASALAFALFASMPAGADQIARPGEIVYRGDVSAAPHATSTARIETNANAKHFKQAMHSLNVERNPAEAMRLLMLAARNHHAPSQNAIGFIYDKGLVGARDPARAAHWYRLAADQSYGLAQINLGLLYRDGDGVNRDDAIAFAWFERAAHLGYPEAQYTAALMLEDGKGTEADPAAAADWYRAASRSGLPWAMHNLGALYLSGRGVARDLQESVRWFRQAAHKGVAQSQLILGSAYVDGIGVPRNTRRGLFWLSVAASTSRSNEAIRSAAAARVAELALTMPPEMVDEARLDAAGWSPPAK